MLEVKNVKIFNQEEVENLWTIYNESFRDVNINSPCKQSFNKNEFIQMLYDNTVEKFILKNNNNEIGIGLVTNNFNNLPWISKDYFLNKFPESFTNNKIYYFMGIAIDKNYRKRGYTKYLLNKIFHNLDNYNIIGFDHSKKVNPFIPKFTKLIKGISFKKRRIESQNYYIIEIKNKKIR